MKSILIALILSCPLWAFSQENEGVIRYLMTQNWAKKIAAVDYISQQQKDKSSYMAGNDSEWKKYTTLYFNATETKYEDSEEEAEEREYQYAWKKEAFWIKRDYANNKTYDVISMLGNVYIVEDTIAKIDWKILNEMKEVAGHVCMNATYKDSITLHNVTAWFALDMPMNAGPERFNGLPGCILEVDINDGAVVLSADKIEMKKLDQEMALPKKKVKGKKVDESGYQKRLQEHYTLKRKNQEPPFWGLRY